MKSMQEFIRTASEGGWKYKSTYAFMRPVEQGNEQLFMFCNYNARHPQPQIVMVGMYEILMDPNAWRGVSHVKKWKDWRMRMVQLFVHVINDKTILSYLDTL